MMSQFELIELEAGRISKRIYSEAAEKGQRLTFNQLDHLVFPELIEKYVHLEKYDELIDYLLDQWDTDSGDEHFLNLSKHLVERAEKVRVVRLWRTVIANRKHSGYKNASLIAMRYFLDALSELHDVQLYNEIKEDMDLFIQGIRPKLPKPDPREIDESLFWHVIAQVKSEATHVIERPLKLSGILEKFSAPAIKQFAIIFQDKLLQSFRHDIWAIAYIAHGGCSDDGFLYFRSWLISEGKQIFEAALHDPESLVGVIDAGTTIQLEALLFAADRAYERRANKQLNLKTPKQQQPAGEPWAEQDLPLRFPNACKKFSWRN
ncbi:DUF4240 domain-containing protein [bacterium]|nr:DUF4240 domain-containing protein [bacterium]